MLVKINESMAEDKFKDPTINKDAALWNDTRPHYNVGHVVPERDVKFEVIKGHEDHGPQPILVWNGKRLHPRAEMIVFNSKTGEILIRDNPSYKNSNVPFELPGGGLMEGKSFLETAIIEVKQEVRMNVRDAWDSHIYYINQSPDGTEQEWTTWGDYSQICCGICDGIYTGEIDDQDKDEDMARDAKWVRIEEVNLTPAHEEAIREYKRFLYSRGNSGYEVVKEAVIDTRRIHSFDDLKGQSMDNYSLQKFLSSFIKYNESNGTRLFRWPEDVFDEGKANCVEISIFLKYYFDSIGVNSVPVNFIMLNSRLITMGDYTSYMNHMMLFNEGDDRTYIWNIGPRGLFVTTYRSDIDGTIDRTLSQMHQVVSQNLPYPDSQCVLPIKIRLYPNDLDIIDECYGSNITQDELLKKTNYYKRLNNQTRIRSLLLNKRGIKEVFFKDVGAKYAEEAFSIISKNQRGGRIRG